MTASECPGGVCSVNLKQGKLSDPDAVEARRLMVLRSHPLLNKPKEPEVKPIPVTEALALLMEARDCYEERLRSIIAEIDILKEMA